MNERGTMPDMSEWRIVSLADHPQVIPTLAHWQHEQWGCLNADDSCEKRAARMRVMAQREVIPTLFVAIDAAGAPLGSASLVTEDLPERADLSPWLASVYVHPPFRGRGIASALVRRVVHEAARLDVDRLYLFTWDQESLYAKLGWRVVERTTHAGEPVVVMAIDPGIEP